MDPVVLTPVEVEAVQALRQDVLEALTKGAGYHGLWDTALDSYLENRVDGDEHHNSVLRRAADREVRLALAAMQHMG